MATGNRGHRRANAEPGQYRRWMSDADFVEELPDDPRRSGWGQEWHAPNGQVSHMREVKAAGVLRVGERADPLVAGDFIAWQDGDYKAVSHDEFVASAWDLAGPSALEFDALTGVRPGPRVHPAPSSTCRAARRNRLAL